MCDSEDKKLTLGFLIQACSRMEDAQSMDKLLEVNDIVLLGVKALEHLVYKNVAPPVAGLEDAEREFVFVNQVILQTLGTFMTPHL